ncbi:hypothetical protein ES708_35250 [subsurface metagenome]
MVVKGPYEPQSLAGGEIGTYLQGKGFRTIPAYSDDLPPLVTQGDLIVEGSKAPARLAAGDAGTYLQGKGAGVLPAYESSMPPLTTEGDLIVQGAVNPTRLEAQIAGRVLTATGIGSIPFYTNLFNILTTQGDLWVRGATDPQRIAAGLLDTYFKGQGAGELPIYEKMTLRDTGIKIGTDYRDSSGVVPIAGVGFQPSLVIIIASDGTTENGNWSIGMDDKVNPSCLYNYDNGVGTSVVTMFSILIQRDAANKIRGNVTAFGPEGFTITWQLSGACDCNYKYLCLP